MTSSYQYDAPWSGVYPPSSYAIASAPCLRREILKYHLSFFNMAWMRELKTSVVRLHCIGHRTGNMWHTLSFSSCRPMTFVGDIWELNKRARGETHFILHVH